MWNTVAVQPSLVIASWLDSTFFSDKHNKQTNSRNKSVFLYESLKTITHPPDTRSWCSLRRASSGGSPRTAVLPWGWRSRSPGGAACPGSLYLQGNIGEQWDSRTLQGGLNLTANAPVHCFFTSLAGIGCTATRYLGSASEMIWKLKSGYGFVQLLIQKRLRQIKKSL